MKSYYCFIRESGLPRPDCFIYHVGVGSSDRDQAKLKLVQEYAKDCGLYFKLWSTQVDVSLDFATAKFPPVKGRWSRPFLHAMVSISQLYRMIIDDTFIEYEATMKNNLWPVYHPSEILREVDRYQSNPVSITKCPTSPRKNLSLDRLTDGVRAAVCLGFILGLFLLDAFISPVIENLFR